VLNMCTYIESVGKGMP